jgi:hypothetical protein
MSAITAATMTAITTGVTVATVAAAPVVADIPPGAVARPAVAGQPAVASARRDSDTFAPLPTLEKLGKTSSKKNARQSQSQ